MKLTCSCIAPLNCPEDDVAPRGCAARRPVRASMGGPSGGAMGLVPCALILMAPPLFPPAQSPAHSHAISTRGVAKVNFLSITQNERRMCA
jgi:hypothetical protein